MARWNNKPEGTKVGEFGGYEIYVDDRGYFNTLNEEGNYIERKTLEDLQKALTEALKADVRQPIKLLRMRGPFEKPKEVVSWGVSAKDGRARLVGQDRRELWDSSVSGLTWWNEDLYKELTDMVSAWGAELEALRNRYQRGYDRLVADVPNLTHKEIQAALRELNNPKAIAERRAAIEAQQAAQAAEAQQESQAQQEAPSGK